jgi:hypothetical protein
VSHDATRASHVSRSRAAKIETPPTNPRAFPYFLQRDSAHNAFAAQYRYVIPTPGADFAEDGGEEPAVSFPESLYKDRAIALVSRRFTDCHFPRRLQWDLVPLQFAVKRGAADPQHLAGERFVSPDLLEHAKNG